MILYHTTTFGVSERWPRSVARAQAAAGRIAAWLAGGGAGRPAGLVLTGPAAVAWACGGVAPPVDRTAAVDLVWAVFTTGGAALVTTNVEADRILDEYGPGAHGFAEIEADGAVEIFRARANGAKTAKKRATRKRPGNFFIDGQSLFSRGPGRIRNPSNR